MVSSLAISSDGRRAVSCAGNPWDPYQAGGDDVAVRVWDLETGRCLHALEGHTSGVLSVALSPDGRQALSGSSDKTARLWDLEAGLCLRTLASTLASGPGAPSVALSADGRVALLGGRDELPVFDLDSGRSWRTLDAGSMAADDEEEPHFGFVGPVALSADGHLALAGGTRGAIQVWELATGRRLQRLTGHGDFVAVTCVAVSLDAKFALSGDRDGSVRVWDVQTGECLRLLGRHKGWVTRSP